MKLLFFLINMNLGGTEKSFLNLVSTLPSDYQITLLLLEKSGDLIRDIPKNVNLKIVENADEVNTTINSGFYVLFLKYFKEFKFWKSFKSILFHVLSKVDKKNDYPYIFFKNELSKDSEQYDFAIAFAGPHNFITNYIVDKVLAKERVQWIHFDISKIYFNKEISAKNYKKVDYIICVSEDVRNQFLNLMPQFLDKIKVKYNIILFEKIDILSSEIVDDFDPELISIVTVGRLTKEKGHRQFFSSFKKLKEDGFKFCWYIIGSGNQIFILEESVKNLNLTDNIKFLGKKTNPYPYFKSCDIYLQPSYYEGHCVSILEAKYFKKPIICTNFSGAKEEIINEKNGLIVDFHNDLFYESLAKLISDEKLRLRYGDYNYNLKFENKIMSFNYFLNKY
jgi:glycosyltransferase involved in cell wall biosynthesis